MQPEPSLAGDAVCGTSGEDSSELETKGKVGAGEEQEDLFRSGSEDHGGDQGAEGKDNAPADPEAEGIFAFLDKE